MPYKPTFVNPAESILNFSNQLNDIRRNAQQATKDKQVQKEIERNESAYAAFKQRQNIELGAIQGLLDDTSMGFGRDGVQKSLAIAFLLKSIPGAGNSVIASPAGLQEASMASGLYADRPDILNRIGDTKIEYAQPNEQLTESYQLFRKEEELPAEKFAVSREILIRHGFSGQDTPLARWAKSEIERSINESDLSLDLLSKYNTATGGKQFSILVDDGKINLLTGEDHILYQKVKAEAGPSGWKTSFQTMKNHRLVKEEMRKKDRPVPATFQAILGLGDAGESLAGVDQQGKPVAGFTDYGARVASRLVYNNTKENGLYEKSNDAQLQGSYKKLASYDSNVLAWVASGEFTQERLDEADKIDRAINGLQPGRARNIFMADVQVFKESGSSVDDAIQHASKLAKITDPLQSTAYRNSYDKGVTNPRATDIAASLELSGSPLSKDRATGFNEYFGVPGSVRRQQAAKLVQLAQFVGGTRSMDEALEALPWTVMTNNPDNEITDLAVSQSLDSLVYYAQTGNVLTTEEATRVRDRNLALFEEKIIEDEQNQIVQSRAQVSSFFGSLGPLTTKTESFIESEGGSENITELNTGGFQRRAGAGDTFSLVETTPTRSGQQMNTRRRADETIRRGSRKDSSQTAVDENLVKQAVSKFFRASKNPQYNLVQKELNTAMEITDAADRQAAIDQWVQDTLPLLPNNQGSFDVLNGIAEKAAVISGANVGIRSLNKSIDWVEKGSNADSPVADIPGKGKLVFFQEEETGRYMAYQPASGESGKAGAGKENAVAIRDADGREVNQPEDFVKVLQGYGKELKSIPEATETGTLINETVKSLPENFTGIPALTPQMSEDDLISAFRKNASPDERRAINALLMAKGYARKEMLKELRARHLKAQSGLIEKNDYSSFLTKERLEQSRDALSDLESYLSEVIENEASREASGRPRRGRTRELSTSPFGFRAGYAEAFLSKKEYPASAMFSSVPIAIDTYTLKTEPTPKGIRATVTSVQETKAAINAMLNVYSQSSPTVSTPPEPSPVQAQTTPQPSGM
jgi:hypothetical protein